MCTSHYLRAISLALCVGQRIPKVPNHVSQIAHHEVGNEHDGASRGEKSAEAQDIFRSRRFRFRALLKRLDLAQHLLVEFEI